MADKGPLLTSCVIFYLSIGAAIFQILEEPNWESARDRYIKEKENILKKYECLTKEGLDDILRTVSEAAGQGVTITGDKHRNTWDWGNSVIFAATIVTTIGYGNVAPKTKSGRVFCILYGLCGIPLCLVWISELGSFFGDRAKRLSRVMIHKGVSVKKVQFTCTALFLLWGLLFHLVIPPFVFMSLEGWSYLEGIYFSFITLTTVGFGDYVAGVNPDLDYPRLYRILAELWMYMGLAWLSLFFSWNVHMVVEAHKVFRKRRRQRHKRIFDEEPSAEEEKPKPVVKQSVIDIFEFLTEKNDDYSTVIKEIGMTKNKRGPSDNINRSKSCGDILDIQLLDDSPRHKRLISISEVFMHAKNSTSACEGGKEDVHLSVKESRGASGPAECVRTGGEQVENKDGCESDSENEGIFIIVPPRITTQEQNVPHPDGGETRFTISKVTEDSLTDKDGEG